MNLHVSRDEAVMEAVFDVAEDGGGGAITIHTPECKDCTCEPAMIIIHGGIAIS